MSVAANNRPSGLSTMGVDAPLNSVWKNLASSNSGLPLSWYANRGAAFARNLSIGDSQPRAGSSASGAERWVHSTRSTLSFVPTSTSMRYLLPATDAPAGIPVGETGTITNLRSVAHS